MINTFKVLPLSMTIYTTFMAPQVFAEFIDDSHLSLEARNFYMNRDYRDAGLPDTPRHKGESQSKAEDWSQGFILRFDSGFTEGPVGFGVDAMGLLGLKLDSGSGTSGTGGLQRNPVTGEPAGEWSFLGPTAKMRLAKSVLTVGTHESTLPVAHRNFSRLFPQTYQGAQLVSKDIDKLTLTAGQFRATQLRDSADYEDLWMFADGATGGVDTDRFNYAGASYSPFSKLTATYYYAELKDNYYQHYTNLLHVLPLSEKLSLKSNLIYYNSGDKGRTTVDNRNLEAMFTLAYQGHALGLAYEDQSGDTGLPFLGGGTDPWTVNTARYHHFVRAEEDSWQLRYDYNFAAAGIPGLNLAARYMSGDNFSVGGADAKEWERDVELDYVLQSGPLKDLHLTWFNVAYRGSHTTDLDENRLFISYMFKFW